MAYVEISAEKMERFLQTIGFSRRVVGSEVVYIFAHLHYTDVFIKVWTSLPVDGAKTRGKGRDAIRITVAYESDKSYAFGRMAPRKSFGIFKTKRIFRTGSEEDVLDRIHERVREAYSFANSWIRDHWNTLPGRVQPQLPLKTLGKK